MFSYVGSRVGENRDKYKTNFEEGKNQMCKLTGREEWDIAGIHRF